MVGSALALGSDPLHIAALIPFNYKTDLASLCFCHFSRQEPVDHSQPRTLQELSLIVPA